MATISSRLVFAGFGAMVLATAAPAAFAQSPAFPYRCADGTELTATFSKARQRNGSGAVRLQMNGKTVMLPQCRSGFGARYAKGKLTFWIKGNGAVLTRGSRSTECAE